MIETTVDTEILTNEISQPPGTIVGYRVNGKPIYNIAGGDGRVEVDTDDDDDDDTDATDVDEQDDSDDDKDKWVPPSKEDFDKLLAAKSKADSEAAARKRFLRDAGLDPKTGKAVPKREVKIDLGFGDDSADDDDEPQDKGPSKDDLVRTQREVQRQVEREIAKAEQAERRRAAALISAVPSALEEAGWNGRNMPRMLKLLDLDSVEVDSDGDIEGLQDQIDELKKDFPEFFKRQRMKEAAKEVADTKTVGGGKKSVAASEETLDFATRLKNQLYKQG
ncbi:MAG: phage scaffolding protein [Gemmatimonadaceae bacterium]